MKYPLVSIVIPCRNEGPYLKQTLFFLKRAKTELPYEIIVINDGSGDGCCDFLMAEKMEVTLLSASGLGVANARNYGASVARGNFLCFCDAHLIVEDCWLDKLVKPLLEQKADLVGPGIASPDRPEITGYGVTWDDNLNWCWLYEGSEAVKYVPLLPGGCLMVRRGVFDKLRGFEKGFRVFGYDDQEFSLKAWLFGYRVVVAPEVKVLHIFRKWHPYPVSWLDIIHNLLTMSFLHFNQRRIGKIIERLRIHRGFGNVLAQLLFSDVWEKRKAYLARRVYDDDWFMEKFGIHF